MTYKTTYQAAQSVATTIEQHFAAQLSDARQASFQKLAPAPSATNIEKLIDTAFWASLQREEGHVIKISLALLPPEVTEQPVLFQQRLPLTASVLTKLAPGVERPGIHIGVWQENDELYIWGTTRTIPSLSFVVDVSEPGLLVIKHRRLDGFGKYANVAVLKGDQIKIVDEQSAALEDCPGFLTSLLGFRTPFTDIAANVLVQLAVSMRAHKRGGSLLVVPSDTENWEKSIIKPMLYSIAPSLTGLAQLVQHEDEEKAKGTWQEALKREVDAVAGLTAIDGATIISDNYNLLAFGAKIGRASGSKPVDEMIVTEPIVGNTEKQLHPAQNGGSRHLSVAQFVHDQRDALGLVASQDGRFTIFSWSPCKQMVHAHLIDSLLL
ncbi:putative sensor domain DACNV-containing protein [Pontibacter populi]|uniref:Sensor domain DACNV-containing protein n=1 Tax=Pontibacter populi TaxID=890055 RepID=A0ABV1RVH6_9BACT